MSEPVRWGVLGVADIAVKKVIPAMTRAANCRVTAVASRSLERARSAADDLGIPNAYGSYEALLADPDIEAVYMPLPNHLHVDWTMAAAAAGKHVLCEKPLALNAREAERMIEACDRAGVKLMEAFMYRLHPLWVEVRSMVASGAIGPVTAIESVFSYFNDDPDDIRNIVDYGGGALYDVGCYPVNVARMLFGDEPARVKASIKRDDRFGTDILTSAVLDFDGGHAVFTCSTQMEDSQRVEIVGVTGRIVVEIPFNIPPDIPTRLLHLSGGDPPVAPGVEIKEFPPADQYGLQADAFSEAIREDLPVPTPPQDAVANLEVIQRIFEDGAAR